MQQFRLGQLAVILTMVILVCPSIALPETATAQSVPALNFGSPHGKPKAVDPGPRGGAAGAGGPLAGLGASEQGYFAAALGNAGNGFRSGAMPGGEDGSGLGPRFNLNGCAGCHAFPAVGGSSPATNPQVAMATLDGAKNVVPSFITLNGPSPRA